jgi:heme oxygenase
MNSPSLSTADPRVEAVARECEALKSAMSRGKYIRLLLTLATLALLVGFIWLFVRKAQQLGSEENLREIASLAQVKLQDDSSNYMREVEGLVSSTSPVLTEAFMERAKQDLPHYMSALGQERQVLVERLQQTIEDRLESKRKELLEKYQGLVRAEFPDLTEEQYGHMLNNLEAAVENLAKRYYKDEMQAELNKLYDAWDQFPTTEDGEEKSQDEVEDAFISALMDLLQHKLTELDRPGDVSASL